MRRMSLTPELVSLCHREEVDPGPDGSWTQLNDEDFRETFRNHAQIVDKHVPCIVLQGRYYGAQPRHSIFVIYGIEGRNEKIIGVRAPGVLTDPEIEEACQKVLAAANELRK